MTTEPFPPDLIAAITERAERDLAATPIRQKSANGEPKPFSSITRRCVTCGACFIGLAPGKTGECGIWADWQWFCSVECHEAER